MEGNGGNYAAAGRHFRINEKLVRYWRKGKAKLVDKHRESVKTREHH